MKPKLQSRPLFKKPPIKTCFLASFIFLASFSMFAAESDYLLFQNAKITIEQDRVLSVEEAFQIIQEQTDYTFVFPANAFKDVPTFTVKKGIVSPEELLQKSLQQTDFTYEVTDKGAILLKLNPKDKALQINSEQSSVSGTVTDSQGMPLPGVNVIEKGTTNGVMTDFDGNFNIEVDPDAILEISYLGYSTQEISVAGQGFLEINLEEETTGLDEVVVIGYGTETRANLTSAVASVKQETIEKYASGNVGSALQGQMAGVEVTSTSGQPGSGVDIKIRGTSSFGSNTPLYIIDGVPSDINNVSPNDIESLEVLKDGASAAIYGSRAANGVVLITTKRARAGEFNVSVGAYYGIEELAKKIPVMNAQQHVRMMNQAYTNDGMEPFYPNSPESYGEGTDWSDEFFSSAPTQNYNINFSGGSETAKINSSLDYFNQEGIGLNTAFERLSARINSEFKKGKFTFNENFSAFISRTDNTNNSAVWRTLEMPPTVPVYDPNNQGGYGGTYGDMFDIMSPVAAQNLMTNFTKNDYIRGNFSINYEAIDKLNIKLNTGGSINNGFNSVHTQSYTLGTLQNPLSSIGEDRGRTTNWLVEGTVDYEVDFNKHNIKLLAGVSAQKNSYRNTYAYGRGLPNNSITVPGAATQDMSIAGTEWNHTLASQFGRLNYNFDDRYLASATIRRDGSSRFASDNKWAIFPSISAAWRVSNEAFFPENSIFNDVKLRASYGELGNQEIGNYAFSALINSSQHYPFGVDQTLNFGATQIDLASPSIKWETNISQNIGLDLRMLQNTLSFTMDYFVNDSEDLLVRVPIPMTNGSNLHPYQNIGKIRNQGFELGVNWSKDINDFRIDLGGTLSSVKNEVLNLGASAQKIWDGAPYHLAENTTLTQEGGEVAAFHLIQTDGVFQNQEEINNHSYTDASGATQLIQPNAVPGDIRFIDHNQDGVINSDDRVYKGSAMPDFTYGLNINLEYKNFDLSAFFYGSQGNEIYNGTAYTIEGMANFTNMSSTLLDAWTPENPSNTPRVTRLDPNQNGRTSSDRFLEDGSYLRLKNLQLGYNLPSDFLESKNIQRMRIYVAAQNLFTITDYSGYNPDIYSGLLNRGVDTGIYPFTKNFRIGVQLSL